MQCESESVQIQELRTLCSVPIVDDHILSIVSEGFADDGCLLFNGLQPVAGLFEFDGLALNVYTKDFSGCFDLVPIKSIVGFLASADVRIFSRDWPLLLDATLSLTTEIREDLRKYMLREIVSKWIERSDLEFCHLNKCFKLADAYFLSLYIRILSTAKDDEMRSYIKELIVKLVVAEPEKFATIDRELLMVALKQDLAVLDDTALRILSGVVALGPSEYLLTEVRSLPGYIGKAVELSGMFAGIESEGSVDNLCYEYVLSSSCEEDYNPIMTCELRSVMELKDSIPKCHLKKAAYFVKLLHGWSEEYVGTFFHAFMNCAAESDKYSELLVVYFLMVLDFPDIDASVGIVAFRYSPLFSQTVTLMRPEDRGHSGVLALRIALFDRVISNHMTSMSALLYAFEYKRFIFAELVTRMEIASLEKSLLNETVDAFAGVIFSLASRSPVEDDIQATRTARSVIFRFLFDIMNDDDICDVFMSSDAFSGSFLLLMLQFNSLRMPVLRTLGKFLARTSESVVGLVGFVKNILNACITVHDEKRSDLPDDLIRGFNVAMAMNDVIGPEFHTLVGPITSFLEHSQSATLLSETLHFICHISVRCSDFSLSLSQMQQLSVALRRANDTDPSEEIEASILRVIGGSKSIRPNLGVMFMIKNPTAVIVWLSILRTSEKMRQSLDYIVKLCRYAVYNCVQCHAGEVELLFIAMIENVGKEFSFRGCIFDALLDKQDVVNHVLPLCGCICAVKTSPIVATNLLLQIVPGRDKQLPICAKEVLSLMNVVMSDNVRIGDAVIPLGFDEKPLFVAENLPRLLIENGFSIQASINLDAAASRLANTKHEIMSIFLEDNSGISVCVCGDDLLCRVIGYPDAFDYTVASLPSCSWCEVTGEIWFPAGTRFAFAFYVGGVRGSEFVVNGSPLSGATLRVSVGSTISRNAGGIPQVHSTVYLASVHLLSGRVSSDRMPHALVRTRRRSECTFPLICGYPGDSIQYAPMTAVRKVDVVMSLMAAVSREPVFNLIVPLFGRLSDMSSHMPEMLLDIVGSVLALPSFVLTKYDLFSVIGDFLKNADPSKLTYSIYQRLFALTDVCDESLTASLIGNVLLDFELWSAAENSQLIRIINHWNSSLYSSYSKIVSQTCDFVRFLSRVRMYFWFDPVESLKQGDIGSLRPRDSRLDIVQVRQAIDRFAKLTLQRRLTRHESIALLGHCALCADAQQCISFFNLFAEIGCEDPEMMKYIFPLFRETTEDLVIVVLQYVYRTSGANLAKHIDSIICTITTPLCTRTLLNTCIELMPSYPLIYRLVIRMSLSIGVGAMVDVAKALSSIALKNSRIISSEADWMLWPVILGAQLEKGDFNHVIYFLGSVMTYAFDVKALKMALVWLDMMKGVQLKQAGMFETELLTTLAGLNAHKGAGIQKSLFKLHLKFLLTKVGSAAGLASSESQKKIEKALQEAEPGNSVLFTSDEQLGSPSDKTTPFSPQGARMRLGRQVRNMARRAKSLCLGQISIIMAGSIDRVTNVHDLLCMMSVSSGIHYTFDIDTMFDSKPAIDSFEQAMSLFDTGSYSPIVDIIRNKINGVELTREMEITMRKFCSRIADRWALHCKVEANRLHDLWDAVVKRSDGSRCELTREWENLRRLTNDYIRSEQRRKCLCVKQERWIMKDIAHSCVLQDTVYTKSSRVTPWFSSYLVKQETPKKACVGNILDSYNCRIVNIREVEATCHFHRDRIVLNNETVIEACQIRYIFKRMRRQCRTAIEIFVDDGRSYLIDFAPNPVSSIMKEIKALRTKTKCVQVRGFKKFFKRHGRTADWTSGKISNFEYLCHINTFANRSFHDAAIYPIMPWSLNAFHLPELDLEDPGVYRNLSYPVFSQTENQRTKLAEKIDIEAPITMTNVMSFTAPSNPTVVAHWMIRLEPFSSLHIDTEGGHFGCCARLFHDMQTAFDQVSVADGNWELMPEFYSVPEFLFNMNHLDIQGRFTDVVPPKWAGSNIEFVYKHRKALESKQVSDNLHNWIDLVFGDRSRGQKAFNSYNVVNPFLFQDVWKRPDIEDSTFISGSLEKLGEMPPMLFLDPHPKRCVQVATGVPASHGTLGKSVVAAVASFSDAKTVQLLGIHESGSVVCHQLKHKSDSVKQKTHTRSISVSLGWKYIGISSHASVILMSASSIISVNWKGVECSVEGTLGTCITGLCGSDILMCTSDGDIWIVSVPLKTRKKVCSIHCERAIAITANPDFDAIAVATVNGNVLLYSISTGVFRYRYALNGERATDVLITHGWGFILTRTPEHVFLHTINGVLIKSINKSLEITAWITWKSPKGFDFLAVADEKGRILVTEAFELSFHPDTSVSSCQGRVIFVDYLHEPQILAAIMSDGRYFIIPCAPDV